MRSVPDRQVADDRPSRPHVRPVASGAVLAAALLVLAIGSPPRTLRGAEAQAASSKAAPAPPADSPLYAPPFRWLPSTSAGVAGGQRHALLVGVGKHTRHPAWDLPWVQADINLVEKTLLEKAGFHGISRLENNEVSKASIETRLQKIASGLGGEDNLLLVFWSGHGYLGGSGEYRYFLADADETPGGGYRNTIGESDLAEVFAPLRRSGKVRVPFVADACRVAVMAPARTAPRLVTVADAALYSTKRGEFASPAKDERQSAFVESFEVALTRLSAKAAASLGEVVDAVRQDMVEKGLSQAPDLTPDRAEIRSISLFDRANLTLGARVIHGLSREELRGAVVKIAGLEKTAESPAMFRGLAEGDYRLEVSGDGFFRELVDLEVDEKHSGRTIEVALSPEYATLEGTVVDEQGTGLAGVVCSLAGSQAGFLRGYHTAEATTDAQGRFTFKIPPRAAVRAVVASAGPRGRRELPVELSKLSPRESVARGRILRSYAVGAVTVPSGAVVRVEELGIRGVEAGTWKAAEDVLEKALAGGARMEDLDIAIAGYQAVLASVEKGTAGKVAPEKVRGRLRLAWSELLAHQVASGRYDDGGTKAAEALKDFPGDASFEEARATCLREAIPPELRRRIADASRAVDSGNFHGAETIYREVLVRSADLTPVYRGQVEENLGVVVEKLLTDAVTSLPAAYLAGEYEKAVALLEDLRRLQPGHPFIELMETKLASHLDPEPPAPEVPAGFTPLAKNAQGYPEYRHDRTGIVFVLLPGGKFRMGSPDGEANRFPDEGPLHEVELSPFLIAKHEVTQAEWEKVMGSNPSDFKGADLPVEQVSWTDCQEFCRKVALQLPTEAQWEYACRAGESGPYAGTGRLEDMGWYDENSRGRTHPVGQKQPNGFGLHDIHGNVWELCEDVYDSAFYAKAEARRKDPACTSGSVYRIIRGGGWTINDWSCRSARRNGAVPGFRGGSVGFRPAVFQ